MLKKIKTWWVAVVKILKDIMEEISDIRYY